ncbi:hypothetical protein D3C77_798630 [compost metagenome]
MAEQNAFGLAGSARGIDNHAGGIHGRTLEHQRWQRALREGRELAQVQRRDARVVMLELTVMQQHASVGVA